MTIQEPLECEKADDGCAAGWARDTTLQTEAQRQVVAEALPLGKADCNEEIEAGSGAPDVTNTAASELQQSKGDNNTAKALLTEQAECSVEAEPEDAAESGTNRESQSTTKMHDVKACRQTANHVEGETITEELLEEQAEGDGGTDKTFPERDRRRGKSKAKQVWQPKLPSAEPSRPSRQQRKDAKQAVGTLSRKHGTAQPSPGWRPAADDTEKRDDGKEDPLAPLVSSTSSNPWGTAPWTQTTTSWSPGSRTAKPLVHSENPGGESKTDQDPLAPDVKIAQDLTTAKPRETQWTPNRPSKQGSPWKSEAASGSASVSPTTTPGSSRPGPWSPFGSPIGIASALASAPAMTPNSSRRVPRSPFGSAMGGMQFGPGSLFSTPCKVPFGHAGTILENCDHFDISDCGPEIADVRLVSGLTKLCCRYDSKLITSLVFTSWSCAVFPQVTELAYKNKIETSDSIKDLKLALKDPELKTILAAAHMCEKTRADIRTRLAAGENVHKTEAMELIAREYLGTATEFKQLRDLTHMYLSVYSNEKQQYRSERINLSMKVCMKAAASVNAMELCLQPIFKELEGEIDVMKRKHELEMSSRDREISELRVQTAALQASLMSSKSETTRTRLEASEQMYDLKRKHKQELEATKEQHESQLQQTLKQLITVKTEREQAVAQITELRGLLKAATDEQASAPATAGLGSGGRGPLEGHKSSPLALGGRGPLEGHKPSLPAATDASELRKWSGAQHATACESSAERARQAASHPQAAASSSAAVASTTETAATAADVSSPPKSIKELNTVLVPQPLSDDVRKAVLSKMSGDVVCFRIGSNYSIIECKTEAAAARLRDTLLDVSSQPKSMKELNTVFTSQPLSEDIRDAVLSKMSGDVLCFRTGSNYSIIECKTEIAAAKLRDTLIRHGFRAKTQRPRGANREGRREESSDDESTAAAPKSVGAKSSGNLFAVGRRDGGTKEVGTKAPRRSAPTADGTWQEWGPPIQQHHHWHEHVYVNGDDDDDEGYWEPDDEDTGWQQSPASW